jgi:hypothetical protein
MQELPRLDADAVRLGLAGCEAVLERLAGFQETRRRLWHGGTRAERSHRDDTQRSAEWQESLDVLSAEGHGWKGKLAHYRACVVFFFRKSVMIRKLKSGQYRLYSRKKDPKTGKRRNLGTFKTLAAAKKHERAVQFFKRH